jgi:aspartate dehydrogenase
MRVGLLGAGAIGEFVLEATSKGQAGSAKIVAVAARGSAASKAVAAKYGVPYVHAEDLPNHDVRVIVEAAGHTGLIRHGLAYVKRGVNLVVLSAGALSDDDLLASLIKACRESGARMYVPSGGIAGMDGVKAMMIAGAEVSITTRKPPRAWKSIEYVERLGVDLDSMKEPIVLYDGEARRGVKYFPQNVNIAAVLSLAGAGFDKTKLRVVADPTIDKNIHEIRAAGPTGSMMVRMENVPLPSNPKTAWQAALSSVAILKHLAEPMWVGG